MIFNHPGTPYPERLKVFEALCLAHPGIFKTNESVAAFLRQIVAPKSKRWVYSFSGKTGSSSTKKFLFELEFRSKFSVEMIAPNDINPSVAVHRLVNAGVFRLLVGMPDPLGLLDEALRITTVRHPTSRAISSFLYLCQTHDHAHIWMSDDRLRMNALVDFDWDNDVRTPTGFEKFMRYIEASPTQADQLQINSHWRPQIDNIIPEVFHPDIIGRTENLAAFFREVAERLDRPLPAEWSAPVANRTSGNFERSSLLTPTTRALIEQVYARDFNWLGYEPDNTPALW